MARPCFSTSPSDFSSCTGRTTRSPTPASPRRNSRDGSRAIRLRYYVTSQEVGRRFEAAADRYPDEAAFHRWIRSRGTLVWTTDSVRAAGPRIEVWSLPERISDPEQRDRLWEEARRKPMYELRLAHWCRDLAMIFLKRDQYARAEEWAARGLTIGGRNFRQDLLETLALARVRLGKPSEAAETARAGVTEFPRASLLHLDYARTTRWLTLRSQFS